MIDLANGQIDRYEVRERIGAGGMARVYKAWDTSLERLVAIKILHEHLADDPTFKERFEREAKFVAGFNHPNIVQVYDFNVIYRDGYPIYYMVMSYIPGKTLSEMMQEYHTRGEHIPRERVTMELVNDLTSALGYAHLRGMVHRDVKPGNILLNEHDSAVLTDFGIARLVQSNRLTQDGISTGTPIYMSPEQANGQGGDMRSDLYSLGIIVYEMLSGRPPFNDDSSLSVMLKHLNTPPPLISDFIRITKYDGFLARALAKNPDERFQTASDFAQAFRATFSDVDHERTTILPSQAANPVVQPTSPLNSSVLKTISQKARENPRTSTAIFVAVLGAVALLVLLLINSTAFRQSATPQTDTITASEVPSMTGSDQFYFTSSFSSDDSSTRFWSTTSTEFITREFTPDGFYRMHNIRPFTAETSIFESNQTYKNVSIVMVGRLDPSSQQASAYGIVFRYQDENNYNVFSVDGEGRYSIWVRTDGNWQELRKKTEQWTSNDAIHPLGQDNTLSISMIGSYITGYVNDQRVTRVSDNSLPDGRAGIYFATDDGEATALINSYRIYSSVPSMTGS